MDVSAIDFDTLFEDISSEHADLLRSTLHESLKRFRVFTQVCFELCFLPLMESPDMFRTLR